MRSMRADHAVLLRGNRDGSLARSDGINVIDQEVGENRLGRYALQRPMKGEHAAGSQHSFRQGRRVIHTE